MITAMETTRLPELETVIERGQQTFIEVGLALTEIRESRLYKREFSTFEDYCQTRWGWKRRYVYDLIESSFAVSEMCAIAHIETPLPKVQNEGQARELAKIKNPETRAQVWQQVNKVAAEFETVVTAKLISEVISKPHVSFNSGNNEWYTPPAYIEAARGVLEEIDLDPASSEIANQTVQASTYLTAEDDGLSVEWQGRIFMNPPYSSELIGKFAQKLVNHYLAEDVSEAICLVNNATETNWFQTLLSAAPAVCFVSKRVKFLDQNGNPSGAPLQGQAILYLGKNRQAFMEHFSQFGKVLYG